MAPHPYAAPASYLPPASFNFYTPGAWSNPNGWPKLIVLAIFLSDAIRRYPMNWNLKYKRFEVPSLCYPTPSDASYPTLSDVLGSQIQKDWGPPSHPSDAIRRHPTALKNLKKNICFEEFANLQNQVVSDKQFCFLPEMPHIHTFRDLLNCLNVAVDITQLTIHNLIGDS